MKKLIGIAVMVATLNATESRLAGMNVRSIQTDDITNVLRVSPVYLLDYSNSVIGELGGGPDNQADYAGITYSLNESNALGVYLGRTPGIFNDRALEAVYAADLDAIKFGASLAFSVTSSSPAMFISTSITTSDFGISPAIQLKDIPLDIVLNYVSTSRKVEDRQSGNYTKNTASQISLTGRLRVLESNFLYLTYMSNSGKEETKTGATVTSVDSSANSLAIGYAVNHKYDKGLIVAGVEYNVAGSSVTGIKTSASEIRVNAGVEHNLFSKLTTRFGVDLDIYNALKIEAQGSGNVWVDNSTFGSTAAGVSYGVGYKFSDDLTLDATITEALLYNGPNFIGGGNPRLHANISVVYKF